MGRKLIRLDDLLISRGLAADRVSAFKLILAGKVRVDGATRKEASMKVAPAAEMEVRTRSFVGKGGLKLDSALRAFGVDVADMICLDAGASTGGFTDCLLKRGAAKVYAVDVAAGIIDMSLRGHPQVVLMERQNVRAVDGRIIPEQLDFITADLSFISLKKVLGPLAVLLRPGGLFTPMVKPQFEAPRELVPEGGVVIDPEVHRAVVAEIAAFAGELGLEYLDICIFGVKGVKGNTEFFLLLRKSSDINSAVEEGP